MTVHQPARATTPLNPNKDLWEKGDFTQIAAAMRDAGEALIDNLGITPAMTVLDLGCGDGTTALPAARLGAQVLGVDIAANLVAAGTARAHAEGLTNLSFHQGDASRLNGIENARFDRVISIFGAMFAPRPFDVAREMVRVTRSGGRIIMGNWIAGDATLVAQILKISAAYTPPPPEGFVSPMSWGVVDQVHERFAAAGIDPAMIECTPARYRFRLPEPPAALLDRFRRFYGPTMNAFEAAAKEGSAEALQAELLDLFERHNEAGPNATDIPARYLQAVVRMP